MSRGNGSSSEIFYTNFQSLKQLNSDLQKTGSSEKETKSILKTIEKIITDNEKAIKESQKEADSYRSVIPRDQQDKVKIKQLGYKIGLLETKLANIKRYTDEICPWNEELNPPEDNAVQSVCAWVKSLLENKT